MATKEQYENALVKAENFGLSSLDKQQLELVKVLYKQSGSLGNRARRAIDGK
ncbi:hypothetical protein ACFWFH_03560 [Streptomyces coelicoflavus]|uniref:hypothetical protein n=1 Tax=Streptomyces TaxID=1883 RepID=UPI001290C652|nr:MULTISPECIES: hypothetical protein [Streptomyces]MCX5037410.1 hypothetical protein [Streptomyces coelicoflavus]